MTRIRAFLGPRANAVLVISLLKLGRLVDRLYWRLQLGRKPPPID